MGIVASEIVSVSPQIDGTSIVDEKHTDHNGVVYDITYTADADFNLEFVMNQRAIKLGEQIDLKERMLAEANNFKLPISPFEFACRFTPQERIAIRNRALTDPVCVDIMDLLAKTSQVHGNHPNVVAALSYLYSQGLITAERKVEIGDF